MRTRKSSRGFTLIELLVVIAIIGLLSSVVLASLNGARVKSRDARRLADLKQLQIALELYYSSQTNGAYPAALSSLAPTYISAEPKDPQDNVAYFYAAGTAPAQTYCLGTDMEGTPPPGDSSCTVTGADFTVEP